MIHVSQLVKEVGSGEGLGISQSQESQVIFALYNTSSGSPPRCWLLSEQAHKEAASESLVGTPFAPPLLAQAVPELAHSRLGS